MFEVAFSRRMCCSRVWSNLYFQADALKGYGPEGFFGMLKRERTNRRRYRTLADARANFRLHRALPQPEDPAQTRCPGSGVQCLNSTVHENRVEPERDEHRWRGVTEHLGSAYCLRHLAHTALRSGEPPAILRRNQGLVTPKCQSLEPNSNHAFEKINACDTSSEATTHVDPERRRAS